ncbi:MULTISPECIES: porin [Alphaproteobacteria]|uniref:Porin n=2 Tax=Alphaproteobacteria TaxID=28211 RepID=A0A512HG88_9HYPH|nr:MULTISPECIES: porin [Alphaproteobacteria]GEO84467.1 outer membrane protein [Ciceribacter naphthalenivorans]GLR22430.1 outer membrane protein [Ciceribacter naphthalenivorans]GLT05286.1 outer membrane protein [Sphingomonas psychrolutea]
MNIKSLLLGSAAALAVVSGAQAADAIVAAEPEPMEYVRVCDAFGTGYFYIPGTETCLKIGGYVRAEIDFADNGRGVKDWDMWTRARLEVSAKNDSELGTIGSFFAFQSKGLEDYTNEAFKVDEAYITVGGFKVGYMYNYWDTGLAGETDDLGSNLINAIGYEYSSDAFSLGVFVDEINGTYADWTPTFNGSYGDNDSIGVEAQLSGTFGVVNAALLGAYDFAREDGAVRLLVNAEIGPGTLGVAGIYSSGVNAYYDLAEWTIAASYSAKLTDKLTLTPGAQYFWNYGLADANGDFTGSNDAWTAGLTMDYALAQGLAVKTTVNYFDADNTDGEWSGFVRLQRSF